MNGLPVKPVVINAKIDLVLGYKSGLAILASCIKVVFFNWRFATYFAAQNPSWDEVSALPSYKAEIGRTWVGDDHRTCRRLAALGGSAGNKK
jgi:hypothetical protein